MKYSALQNKFNIISEIHSFDELDLYLIEGNIVVSEYKKGAELNLKLAKRLNALIKELSNGNKIPSLFLACPDLTLTKEVREFGATPEASESISCTAIVSNTLAHRIIGNFFIKMQKPPIPTKMFSNVGLAIEWLKAQ